jgi:ABC-type glycerol-3-phosphate transport system substrate-binding protein
MKKLFLIMAAATVLAACGERPQTASGARQDAAPYTGTGKAFVAAGWKQGDKTSWESHLKARGQNSQNDYAKSN